MPLINTYTLLIKIKIILTRSLNHQHQTYLKNVFGQQKGGVLKAPKRYLLLGVEGTQVRYAFEKDQRNRGKKPIIHSFVHATRLRPTSPFQCHFQNPIRGGR